MLVHGGSCSLRDPAVSDCFSDLYSWGWGYNTNTNEYKINWIIDYCQSLLTLIFHFDLQLLQYSEVILA